MRRSRLFVLFLTLCMACTLLAPAAAAAKFTDVQPGAYYADAVDWAVRGYSLGAGEILLTSMDCDGTKAGYDCLLTRTIAERVPIPVIASGGAGTKEHFYDALTEGKADAALAASLFHYKELEIRDLKEYLKSKGVPVRL